MSLGSLLPPFHVVHLIFIVMKRFHATACHSCGKLPALSSAMQKIMSNEQSLTHLDNRGEAHMVDVGDKEVTQRVAVARSKIRMAASTLAAIESSELKKGDALATARIAAIQAAKKTSDLIPLCHPLPITKVSVDMQLDHGLPGVVTEVTCKVRGQTGIEMEALTAASVAALTIYDMAKGLDRGMVIEEVTLLEKTGGKSGEWRRDG